MLRVLLVDDEPFIAKGLSILIDWQKEGFEIVNTLSNGSEALEYLKENTVELIIADISMPVMTGLELLENIKQNNISDAYFVLLSGYSNFSYARRALRSGCMDYLLKPVEKEELLSILRNVASMSQSTKETEKSLEKMEKAYLARNIIALLVGKYDEINLEHVKANMKLTEGVRYISLEIGEIQDEEELEDSVLRQNQRDMYEACQELLGDTATHCVFDVSQDEKNYEVGLIYCDGMAENSGMSEREYLENLNNQLAEKLQHSVRMLIGKKVNDISAVSKSYSAAGILRSLEAFHVEKNLYYYEEEVQINRTGIVLCKDRLDELIDAIQHNERELICERVEALYEELKQMGASVDNMKLNINYLIFQLIHLAVEQDGEVDQDKIMNFISESSLREGTIRGNINHLSDFACEYSDYLRQLRKNSSSDIMDVVEKEIKENFADNLTLKGISAKYFVNSSYLGQLFRKRYGQSFKDYLNNYRINEAARLLVSTENKINNIAEYVGYKDSDYFVRKFIELKGCTPSSYRKNN